MSHHDDSPYRSGVDFAVLGPLVVLGPDGPIDIAGAKERALLAHLLAASGRMVSTEELTDNLWGEDPPRTATKSLQNYVLRLRNTLEPDRNGRPRVLLTDGPGYRLEVSEEAVDARWFARLVSLGRQAVADGRLETGSSMIAEALSLWRGPAYAGMRENRVCGAEGRRLEELRATAVEDRVAADVDRGLARLVVPELDALVHEHPLRERLWFLLVLALYRSERQAAALAAYTHARQVLQDELGVEPGDELRRLHARVLSQDPSLRPDSPPQPLPRQLRPGSGPFVGRSCELDLLIDGWAEVERGSSRTFVLRGAPGSGASRLAAELARVVSRQGGPVEHLFGWPTTWPPVEAPTLTVVDAGELRTVDATSHVTGATGPRLVLLLHAPARVVLTDAVDVPLPSLDEDGVREVLASYLPTGHPTDIDDETVCDLLRTSGGLPGRVHEEALAVARRRSHERVGERAERTTRIHTALTAARESLVEGVEEYRTQSERSKPVDPDVCPWKGLVSYEVPDAPWFAGRERLVAELLARLASAPVLVVVGPSGSGKSSLVRAGLLASLASGALPGSEGWTQLVMRPGRHPLRELARIALVGREKNRDEVADLLKQLVFGEDPDRGTVLVVDQLEEVWTACTEPAEQRAFLEVLSDVVESQARCRLVLAVRADYVGELADHPVLTGAMADATVLVGAPTEAEVRRAVEHPAARAGLDLDTGLADAVAADAGQEPGALPLLSTALAELWGRRVGDRLTLDSYVRAGGLRGAVARIAERAYGSLGEADQAAARILLLRLAGPGESDRATRRRVPLAELADLPDPRVREVVAPLARARLVTVGADHVEVAHEALFREWPRLRGWLEVDAEARAVQRRLVVAAAEWEAGGRESAELWRGPRLVAGMDFVGSHPGETTDVERAFVEAGQALQDTQRRETEERAATTARHNRLLRRLLGAAGLLLVLAIVAGAFAVQARSRAEREATVATARGLASAAAAALETDPELAVLLALEGVERARTVGGSALQETESALHRAMSSSRIDSVVPELGAVLDISPDGETYAAVGAKGSGRVEIRDLGTGEPVRTWDAHDGDVLHLVLSADGAMLATTGNDGTVKVWDPRTGALLHTVEGAPGSQVLGVSLSPDGRLLAAAWVGQAVVQVWELSTGRLVHELPTVSEDDAGELTDDPGFVTAFSPDGSQLAYTFDGAPRVLDLVSGRTVRDLVGHEFVVTQIEWSPDGTLIATGAADNSARVWNAATGVQQSYLLHPSTVVEVAWSDDGSRLATGARDGVTRVWEFAETGPVEVMTLSALSTRQGVFGLGFSPDGERLLTGSDTTTRGSVTTWDVGAGGDAEWANYPGDNIGYAGLDYTADGTVLGAGSGAGAVRLWDVTTGEPLRVLGPHRDMPADAFGTVYSVEISPDGSMVAATGGDDTATVWNWATGDEVFSYRTSGWTDSLAWTPDGRHLAVSSWGVGDAGGEVVVLDLSGAVVARLGTVGGETLSEVDVGPDGTIAAVAGTYTGYRGTQLGATIWDWRRDEVVREVEGDFLSTELGPDGNRIALAGLTSVWVRDIETGDETATLTGFATPALDVTWSADGSRIATGHEDGEVRVWDAETGSVLLVLLGHDSQVKRVTFSPDGTRLASSQGGSDVRVWALDLDDLVDLARDEVTRPLTDDECREYLAVETCADASG